MFIGVKHVPIWAVAWTNGANPFPLKIFSKDVHYIFFKYFSIGDALLSYLIIHPTCEPFCVI